MGFFGAEPFDKAQAVYVWTGLHSPGFFSVTVEGHAPNFTSGIQLVQNDVPRAGSEPPAWDAALLLTL